MLTNLEVSLGDMYTGRTVEVGLSSLFFLLFLLALAFDLNTHLAVSWASEAMPPYSSTYGAS